MSPERSASRKWNMTATSRRRASSSPFARNCRRHLECGRKKSSAAGTAPLVAMAVAASSRSEEHTSELQSLMRISYAVFCLKKNKKKTVQEEKKTDKSTQNK